MRELFDAGGPDARASAAAEAFLKEFAAGNAIMEFRTHVVGRTPLLFNRLAWALAVLSYLPGGVALFGDAWDIRTTPLPESGS